MERKIILVGCWVATIVIGYRSPWAGIVMAIVAMITSSNALLHAEDSHE